MENEDKEKRRAYDRAYHARRSLEAKRIKVKKQRERRHSIQETIYKYLENHTCVDCPEKDPVVLDFDHRYLYDKKMTVTDLIRNGYAIETIFQEIDKCEVRCANCHRRRTAKQFGWKKGKYKLKVLEHVGVGKK